MNESEISNLTSAMLLAKPNGDNYKKKVADAVKHIHSHCDVPKNTVAIVLGSGLGAFASRVKVYHSFKTSEIPHFPTPSVEGHGGRVTFGTLGDRPVALIEGRVHLYEGWPVEWVTFYVEILRQLGIKVLILTNSAGGINPDFNVGDLCLIRDHINFMFETRLNRYGMEPRLRHVGFYDKDLSEVIYRTANECKITLRQGVYAGVKGPCYETKAEIRMLQACGADLVGMSTVPEVVAANFHHMRVAAVSLVTNKATGISECKLSHDDVKKTAESAREKFDYFLEMVINKHLAW
ncbi:inosine guanosine and xanthosine phosphorylase family [Chloroherpeton thalassium ATCC 35110]|uniref:Purine nucleoside phosphorylase n=1 Tax=Chloroherpeton thalassium (strain ATCC 35110 / GB-78) TaxID=517418 RepID=B3QTH8_CHLT3|nr:purine-nucleoside phosphorylase [Chloroherpeton thalassium]ACF12724.1 inosine guanosine and xanthosine phosphorylase family [Chloroherpeton thalassium ATCC 35110]